MPTRLSLALAATLLVASSASAQERNITVSLSVGSGLSFAGGSGQTTVANSPLHLDLAFRTWVSESGHDRDPIVGAALRVEVQGRASLGIVPRAELAREFGKLQLRPFVGLPVFFAPFSLLGAEVGAALTFRLHGHTRMLMTVVADAYFWGSDLPDGTAIVSLNAAFGFELGTRP